MLLTFVLFGSLGYLFYNEADTLTEFEVRYDDYCKKTRGTGQACEIRFTPDVDLDNPKVYYRLDNFY